MHWHKNPVLSRHLGSANFLLLTRSVDDIDITNLV